jgi:hypothetical protein
VKIRAILGQVFSDVLTRYDVVMRNEKIRTAAKYGREYGHERNGNRPLWH